MCGTCGCFINLIVSIVLCLYGTLVWFVVVCLVLLDVCVVLVALRILLFGAAGVCFGLCFCYVA